MHLLAAQQGSIVDGDEAIDLGQTPGDIVFLSAADTELSALAAALSRREASTRWRLASLMALKHPMSVDTYIERTARHAKLIVVRALGGASYFHYVLEGLFACAQRSNAAIVVLPGDDKPDAGLDGFCNVVAADVSALWGYLIEGGDCNALNFITYAEAIVRGSEKPQPAMPLLKAGLWWPGRGAIGVEQWAELVAGGLPPSVLPDISPSRGGNGPTKPLDSSSASRNVDTDAQDASSLISPPEREMAGKPEGGGILARRPTAAICFYRALVQSGETAPVEALIDALRAEGLNPLPVFVSSLKDAVSVETLRSIFTQAKPDVVLNATGFAVSAPGSENPSTVLDEGGAVVLQTLFSSSQRSTWEASTQGLTARDLAMNVALPEVDGRVLTRAVSFKSQARYDARVETNLVSHEPDQGRVDFVAKLAANWARLRKTPAPERNIALIMANYPNRDGRLGNGVGLDTPAGSMEVLRALKAQGYVVDGLPLNGDALMDALMAGPTNAATDGRVVRERLSLDDYRAFFASLPVSIQQAVSARWGDAETDPFFLNGAFALPLMRFGNIMVGIQPARGYNIDPKESYHSPDLVPPHGYFAFYAFLRETFEAHAVIHMGKHGNLEWLPGKALALSESCYPEAIFGPMPHLYPFIVNDPGEGTQAKRRTSAVIIDHLTPPLTRAETYGPLKDLEALVDEYYQAAGGDPRRLKLLKQQILDLVADIGLDEDAGIAKDDADDMAFSKLDAYLCDLKEMQIRDGLHIFGVAPKGRLLTDLVVALARVPRGLGQGGDASLQRAIVIDAGLAAFDPLDCVFSDPWTGAKPAILKALIDTPWRIKGDTVERIEVLAAKLVSGEMPCPEDWLKTRAVLDEIEARLKPAVVTSGPAEIAGLLNGLSGQFVPPGPSGAPTRGRPDVLPTGRNFYSVDCRAVPTPAAYELGKKSAELLIARYVQDHGEWPTSFGLTAWGTSNMRTGGDDIAQALSLIGVKPLWDNASRRVTGYEVIPQAKLGRPRVDVTLRISGFFRDAFPEQITLVDKAVRAVGALDEDEADNPIAARIRAETAQFEAKGLTTKEAKRRAGYRVFGSKPGAYGAGLQALIDEKGWERRADLAEAYLVWGSYAYGAGDEGLNERGLFEERLQSIEAVVQNQDNREHDLLDSDDYYQFEGGMTAAVEQLSGARPTIYHNDHSRPEKPIIRTLEEEIARVVRARVVNPKWIEGVMRHGYKGAFEIAATVDYLFAFSATTGAVRQPHFEAVYRAFVLDERVRDFMLEKNRAAFQEMSDRLLEAIDRGLWTPKSNSAKFNLSKLHSLEMTHD
ncbi:cobaltochelatase subunit CobN [Rhizobium oryziradicis]|uniref:Cobaltochelatase subunit CobN n=1 Tax=Rhizobium oryziradicis TaxID=1867956 RepID=A0A1Q8ZNX4_9HYPH|nr:cobaltochelatase subunit CobN [Rhizobium oryziradicis]OLP43437.1 cobaltochelatase subunit CobN [Rhizobium oryziradicis]